MHSTQSRGKTTIPNPDSRAVLGVPVPSRIRYSRRAKATWHIRLYRSGEHLSSPSIIAVDGPAGSGKSTVSFAVAQRIGYLFVDTGAFYRAITFLALEQQIDPHDSAQVVALAEHVHLDMTPDLADDGRQYTLVADGRDITLNIHSPQVDANVSVIAANPGVRTAILGAQRGLAVRGRVIMAGRDIGTVVLPDADLKIYIDASLEKRAERRYQQRVRNGESASLDAIREGLRQRDLTDSGRETAPLLQAQDAEYLDTSNLSFEEAVDAVYEIIRAWQPPVQSTV
jgi:cytidylate kinase